MKSLINSFLIDLNCFNIKRLSKKDIKHWVFTILFLVTIGGKVNAQHGPGQPFRGEIGTFSFKIIVFNYLSIF